MNFEYSPYDNPAVQWVGTAEDRALFKAHRDGATILSCNDDIVGALTTWRNPLHPYLMRFVTVTTAKADALPQAELADTLLTPVVDRAKNAGQRGILTVSTDTQSALRSATISRGLRRIRTTFKPKLALKTAHTATVSLTPGTRLLTQSDVLQSEPLSNALIQAAYLTYQKRHEVDPVKPFADNDWAPRILTDLEPTAPLALAQGDNIVAYCLTYLRGNRLEFGGAWGQDHGLLDGLLAYTLPALASRYPTLEGAFADVDEGGMQVYMSFPDQATAQESAAFAILF
ncbi:MULTISPECIES: hypothetical protein [unclassified Lacticaseibacillus]|uniref:hypothetical protein n=1 Tax=unclassified Lacticaseibacillus TaxID=2759744 RepID=UPI001944FA16|nr:MULTISPECIES: hypothetical protein [unclassified Lacticaseibacillus]